ncbi:hypothetical protein AWC29_07300 [Mycobacterium triplex]|uniref:Hypothetical proline rich protein n=1 Tax=Mycobacterium triplex TaxID=47839 RepID=A0A024JXQ1_9MYCO|nr:DUF732 domain-containing protein [Mycobacterium triplex]ORX07109.1 hypothetical protein AWC29_07300 [Mycobacterium triplex]CDO88595.1 hypothetical proline rich protein [Mycobacterium triplex]
MRTHLTGLAGALVGASALLATAVMCAGAARADAQEDQFVALLAQLQIPVIDNVPGLVYRAHEICGELDRGASFQSVVDEETNTTYSGSPQLRLVPDRVTRTAVKFITASVTVYCPSHQGLIP